SSGASLPASSSSSVPGPSSCLVSAIYEVFFAAGRRGAGVAASPAVALGFGLMAAAALGLAACFGLAAALGLAAAAGFGAAGLALGGSASTGAGLSTGLTAAADLRGVGCLAAGWGGLSSVVVTSAVGAGFTRCTR